MMNPAIKVQPITQPYLQAIINTTPRFSIELMPIASQSYNDASKQFFHLSCLLSTLAKTCVNLCKTSLFRLCALIKPVWSLSINKPTLLG